jgi:hypothetical protein
MPSVWSPFLSSWLLIFSCLGARGGLSELDRAVMMAPGSFSPTQRPPAAERFRFKMDSSGNLMK